MDGEVWWDTVHGVVKSRTRMSDFTFTLIRHSSDNNKRRWRCLRKSQCVGSHLRVLAMMLLLIKLVMQSSSFWGVTSLSRMDREYIWMLLSLPRSTTSYHLNSHYCKRTQWPCGIQPQPSSLFFFFSFLAAFNCKSNHASVKALLLLTSILTPLLLRDTKTLRKCSQPQLRQDSDQISSLFNKTLR